MKLGSVIMRDRGRVYDLMMLRMRGLTVSRV
jgi:hypothetical protein